jgi:hypothetical protein
MQQGLAMQCGLGSFLSWASMCPVVMLASTFPLCKVSYLFIINKSAEIHQDGSGLPENEEKGHQKLLSERHQKLPMLGF